MCYDRCGSSSPLSGEKTLFESEGRMSPSGSGNFLSAMCYTCYTVNNGTRLSLDSLERPSEKTWQARGARHFASGARMFIQTDTFLGMTVTHPPIQVPLFRPPLKFPS